MKKSIAIVGTVGLPASYGGWETLVANILPGLVEEYDVTVFCSRKRYETHLDSHGGARLVYVGLDANGIQSIPYDIVSMWRARHCDAMLILGVSGCLALPIIRLLSRARLIVNIDGLEWRRDKWSQPAKLFLYLSEFVGVRASHHRVSDNRVIQDYIEKSHGRDSVLIPYGGDSPDGAARIDGGAPSYPYAFSVCRIEPENNIHIILEAFSQLDVPLIMFGNWNASPYGKDLYGKYGGLGNITLNHPLYDRAKLDVYRAGCAAYIHGHSAGGTNPSLVEAMWLGLTTICYEVDFNRETTENKAFYFSDEESLKAHVRTVIGAGESNAADMKEIAERRYTWKIVTQGYKSLIAGAG